MAMASTEAPKTPAVAVFCAARHGGQAAHTQAAQDLGRGLAELGLHLVYGGGKMGLMGELADTMLAGGGSITGVIPDFLRARELAHLGVSDMVITPNMHRRKQIMLERADAVVMLPGGLGTLDETIEVLTWRTLQLHHKPIYLCNIAGAARGILGAIEAAIEDGFAGPEVRKHYQVHTSILDLLEALKLLQNSHGDLEV